MVAGLICHKMAWCPGMKAKKAAVYVFSILMLKGCLLWKSFHFSSQLKGRGVRKGKLGLAKPKELYRTKLVVSKHQKLSHFNSYLKLIWSFDDWSSTKVCKKGYFTTIGLLISRTSLVYRRILAHPLANWIFYLEVLVIVNSVSSIRQGIAWTGRQLDRSALFFGLRPIHPISAQF